MNLSKLFPLRTPLLPLLSSVLFVLTIFLLGCTQTENEAVAEPPADEVTEPAVLENFYDGWETGVSFSFSDEVPLRTILIWNEGTASILYSAEYDPPSTLSNEETFIMIFSGYPSSFPTLDTMTDTEFVKSLISEDPFMAILAEEVVVEPEEARFGKNPFVYAIGTRGKAETLQNVYMAFGRIGERAIAVSVAAPPSEEVDLQAVVEPILASMELVNYDGWEIYKTDFNFSAALPVGWSAEQQSGFSDHIFYTNADDPQDSDSAIHLHLLQPTDPLGFDANTVVMEMLAEEGTTTISEPTSVAFLDDMVVAAGEKDGQTFLLGVFNQFPHSAPTLVATWNVDDWEANRPIFENVLRSIRPGVGLSIFGGDVSAD